MAEAKRPGGEYLVGAQFENGKPVKGTGTLVNANGEPIEAAKSEPAKAPAGKDGK
jgi:hypothetical protein